jgi:CheY-like chemotaxis protein
LTRRLAQAHGGRIELESELGHGTKFTVYLPAADAPLEAPANHPAAPGTGVLIIEDDTATAQLLSAYLEQDGYQVSIAATGERGLITARACHPEVILLDIHLPGVGGWDLLTELKHDHRLRHVPVVIISAHDDTDFGIALGAVDYFVKPIDRHTLLSCLARHGLVPAMGGQQRTVLAIDDDPASLQLIETHLGAEGVTVVSARGGAAGLALAHARPFDLIICDLLMPDVDGFEVIAALHNNPGTRDTPVVVLTAHTLTETDKARLSGKVVAVAGKGGDRQGLTELTHMVGQLTGLVPDDAKVIA